MKVNPKYAPYIYRNATMLLRPKTQLQDITLEVNPGTPSAGKLHKRGGRSLRSQTAANIDFDQFLGGTRRGERAPTCRSCSPALGIGLKGNGSRVVGGAEAFRSGGALWQEIPEPNPPRELAALDPQLPPADESPRHKDKHLRVVDSSNAVFKDVREGDRRTSRITLPAAARRTRTRLGKGLGKLATAPTRWPDPAQARSCLRARSAPARKRPKACDQDGADHQERSTSVRARNPAHGQRTRPTTRTSAQALPGARESFSVLNEFFNELAYNPGASKAGFLFFLDWATTSSTASSAPPKATARSAAPPLLQLRNR